MNSYGQLMEWIFGKLQMNSIMLLFHGINNIMKTIGSCHTNIFNVVLKLFVKLFVI